MFTAAIVGRPNVGKSTLFNRLVGRREAIVHDRPGVTRDRRLSQASLADLHFNVIDTAGYEDGNIQTMQGRMRLQTEKAIADADVALLLVDARAGITPLDEHFADLLRRSTTPIILVANKCEGKGQESAMLDAFRLGLGDPLAISAEHGQGLDGLYHALVPFAPAGLLEAVERAVSERGMSQRKTARVAATVRETAREVAAAAAAEFDDLPDDFDIAPESAEASVADLPNRHLQLAIIGRPNTGKSTLINRLLGEDRMLVGPEPGVTRDSIPVDWEYKDNEGRMRKIRLVDTAGVRKRAKVTDAVEILSVGETFETIKMAEVVVLVVDAHAVLDNQELTLARHVIDEGRALVIAVNKWDSIKEKRRALETLDERLRDSMSQVKNIPTVTISGLTGQRVNTLMDAVFKVYKTWNTHLPTGALNRWLAAAVQAHPPPLSTHKQRIKLRYITQVKTRPPTFVIFSTRAGDLPEAYMRYLANGIRDTFGLDGVPIRIHLRKPKNPYGE
ncbi:MAG: ribosome biogenesis GTPase Der [Rhodospirillaceae bacterium]|nr:ribosome biogenesis GTPase Der [Rhodospirillaceae bacterium]